MTLVASPSDVPADDRLARFLKNVLRTKVEVAARRYGLRCIDVKEANKTDDAGDGGKDNDHE